MKPHPHPHTGLRVVVLLGGHQIVEFAVEMGHRQHGQHTREGLVLSLAAGGRHSEGVADGTDAVMMRNIPYPAPTTVAATHRSLVRGCAYGVSMSVTEEKPAVDAIISPRAVGPSQ